VNDNPYVHLRLDDVAATCGEIIRKERKEILAHVNRLMKLVDLKAPMGRDDERYKNLHRRICQLESEVRRIRKGLP